MAEDKQVNKAAFLKSLNKKKAAAKVAAKAERPTGLMDDSAILARLGIVEEKQSITLAGRVSKIQYGFAKSDSDRQYFRFAYSISEDSPLSDKGKGLIVSNYHELTEGKNKEGEVYRTEEEALERFFFEFQSVGEDTASWKEPLKDGVEAAEKHTKEKIEIQIAISSYARRDGSLGANYRVVNAYIDNSDLDSPEEESKEEEEEGDWKEWIGGWVTWTDDEGAVDFLVESYNEDEDTFTGKDEDDEEFSDAPTSECEWAENQRDE